MAQSKKSKQLSLVRSDRNLLALGVFSAVLLVAVMVMFNPGNFSTFSPANAEKTYRIQSVPATVQPENLRPEDTYASEFYNDGDSSPSETPEYPEEMPYER